MALFVEQNSNRTKLQEKLAAELQEKARRTSNPEGEGGVSDQKLPDGVEDSAFMEGTKKTTSLAWVWVLLAVVLVGAMIWLVTVALK